MGYKLSPVDNFEDFSLLTPLIFESLRDFVFTQACYPHSDEPERLKQYEDMYRKNAQMDKSQRWLKVIDTECDRIIAAAQWLTWDDPGKRPPEAIIDPGEGYWDTPEDREWAQLLWIAQRRCRWETLRVEQGPIVCLGILVVAPGHQKHGAGSLLLKAGLEEADKIGAKCIVEATRAGKQLYQKYGFRVEYQSVYDIATKFVDRPKLEIICMTRGPGLAARSRFIISATVTP